jgi:hypothetical protein
METFWDYFILALSGALGIGGHLLMKFRDSKTKGEKMKWNNHFLNGGVAIFVISVLLFFAKEVEPIFPLTKLTMFFAGYMTDSVWKNFTKFGSEKMKLS